MALALTTFSGCQWQGIEAGTDLCFTPTLTTRNFLFNHWHLRTSFLQKLQFLEGKESPLCSFLVSSKKTYKAQATYPVECLFCFVLSLCNKMEKSVRKKRSVLLCGFPCFIVFQLTSCKLFSCLHCCFYCQWLYCLISNRTFLAGVPPVVNQGCPWFFDLGLQITKPGAYLSLLSSACVLCQC